MTRNLRGRLTRLESKSEAREPTRYASLWDLFAGVDPSLCDPAKLAELDDWIAANGFLEGQESQPLPIELKELPETEAAPLVNRLEYVPSQDGGGVGHG
jgi:hypothetical protein